MKEYKKRLQSMKAQFDDSREDVFVAERNGILFKEYQDFVDYSGDWDDEVPLDEGS